MLKNVHRQQQRQRQRPQCQKGTKSNTKLRWLHFKTYSLYRSRDKCIYGYLLQTNTWSDTASGLALPFIYPPLEPPQLRSGTSARGSMSKFAIGPRKRHVLSKLHIMVWPYHRRIISSQVSSLTGTAGTRQATTTRTSTATPRGEDKEDDSSNTVDPAKFEDNPQTQGGSFLQGININIYININIHK